MKLFNIPYYLDIEGQVVNGIKLSPVHVKLFGLIIVHDRMGQGCWASTKTLSEELKLTEGTIRNARADLIKAGLITVKRKNSTTEIEYLSIPDVVFSTLNNRGMSSNDDIDVIKRLHAMSSNDDIDNREATPVLNKILNKNIKADSADASSASSKEELEFPFDDSVIDVKANRNGQSPNAKADRRAFAIAGKVYKAMGLSAKPGVKMRNRIKDRLSEGYTEDDILNCLKMCEKDDFYGSQRDPMVWTSEGAMAKYKLNSDRPRLENRDKVTEEYEIKW